MSSDWLRVALFLSEISRFMAWKTNSYRHERLFTIVMSVLSIKDKSEDGDDIVFQMFVKVFYD